MSPLLFFLVVEGLNRMISKAVQEGELEGIHIARLVKTIHLLFVDDVMLFGKGIVKEWRKYKEILDCFCSALGMEVSMPKSTFLEKGLEEEVKSYIRHILPMDMIC